MITEDKITELFCIANDFCKFFDTMMSKNSLKSSVKLNYHRDSMLSNSEVMLIIVPGFLVHSCRCSHACTEQRLDGVVRNRLIRILTDAGTRHEGFYEGHSVGCYSCFCLWFVTVAGFLYYLTMKVTNYVCCHLSAK